MPTTGTFLPFASTIHLSLLENGSGWNDQAEEVAPEGAGDGQYIESVQRSPVTVLEGEDPIVLTAVVDSKLIWMSSDI